MPATRLDPPPEEHPYEGTWGIDAVLYSRILAAHTEAEESYLNTLARDDKTFHSACRIATLNARAEGLARAIAIITGEPVVDVRVRSTKLSEERRQRGLRGVALARKNLAAHLRGGPRVEVEKRGGQQVNPWAPRPPQATVIPAAPPRPINRPDPTRITPGRG